jgi:hypothetical protein
MVAAIMTSFYQCRSPEFEGTLHCSWKRSCLESLRIYWSGTVAAGSTSRELIAAIFPDMTSNPKNVRIFAVKRFPIYETYLVPYQESSGGQKLSSTSSRSPTLPKLKYVLQSTNIIPYSFLEET